MKPASYPFMNIAKKYNANYSDVLNFAYHMKKHVFPNFFGLSEACRDEIIYAVFEHDLMKMGVLEYDTEKRDEKVLVHLDDTLNALSWDLNTWVAACGVKETPMFFNTTKIWLRRAIQEWVNKNPGLFTENQIFTIGDATMRNVFEPNNIKNVSDMQLVWNKIEEAFCKLESGKNVKR